ncbi:hypothetical protein BKA93DRAFT_830639 [Sparassis latifolia]
MYFSKSILTAAVLVASGVNGAYVYTTDYVTSTRTIDVQSITTTPVTTTRTSTITSFATSTNVLTSTSVRTITSTIQGGQ